jgi:ActR/RegA family two-component response regulator
MATEGGCVQHKRILLVEDDDRFRETFAEALRGRWRASGSKRESWTPR